MGAMNDIKNKIRKILPFVRKPAQYLGSEINSVHKNWDDIEVKIALAFPDIYGVGMSFLGYSILYEKINSRSDSLAERVYLPENDMMGKIKENKIPLFSLESKRSLSEFDIAGFTLQYELSYINVLKMLDSSNIAKKSRERDESSPLVIAGGPCCYNPEPVADFFDFFVIGEGEEIIDEIIELYKKHKDLPRRKKLEVLSGIEGIYVPDFYEVKYHASGEIKEIKPAVPFAKKIIQKRRIKDINDVMIPVKPVVPLSPIVHNRLNVEIMRGCTRGCRFCEAGYVYRTKRERDIDKVIESTEKALKNTGYDEVTLLSLSCTDYCGIEELLTRLNEKFSGSHISFSLPSLRLDSFSVKLADQIKTVRKSGLTFAPETASFKSIDFINKCITREDFFNAVKAAFSGGWNLLKLYYMIGFPGEKEEDIRGIVDIAYEVIKFGREARGRSVNLNIGLSSFIPKPFTPFQWDKMEELSSLSDKINYLKRNLKNRIKWHEPEKSFVEAVFARGDRKLSEVLLKYLELDTVNSEFDFAIWQEAFKGCGIDPRFYASRKREFSEILPWDHIDIGITKEFLIDEREKAGKLLKTADCSYNECNKCGSEQICGSNHKKTNPIKPVKKENTVVKQNIYLQKVRLKYEKTNDMIYLSHLDLANLFHRVLRKSGLDISYSTGFNPHPKVEFSFALPLGMESRAEYIDIIFNEKYDIKDIVDRINENSPLGLKILEARYIQLNSISLPVRINHVIYDITLFEELCDGSSLKTGFVLPKPFFVNHWTKKGIKTMDVSDIIETMKCAKENNGLNVNLSMKICMEKNIRPQEIISSAFLASDDCLKSGKWTRSGLFVKLENGSLIEPWE